MSSSSQNFSQAFRQRLPGYAAIILGAWPVLSVLMAALEACRIPYYPVPWTGAVLGSWAAFLILVPDFLVIGALTLFLSLVVFSTLASRGLLWPEWTRSRPITELGLLFLSVLFGCAVYYPAILNHPLLFLLRSLPVWMAILLLGLVIIWRSLSVAISRARVRVLLVVTVIGLLSPLPSLWGGAQGTARFGEAPLVLLGLDSLSHDDDLAPLKDWSDQHAGTWYVHAVPPGLLTNSVWTSLLALQPVREHGVFHTFQPFPKLQAQETLIDKARRAGYWTVSVFPDQLTCAVGTQAGFDEDRSGPVGWRQLATSYVENASLLLPLFRPLFPQLPFSSVPPNHSGTFTYHLDRELDEIFFSRSFKGRTFVAAHLTYLHAPRFPSSAELSWEERRRVFRATVRTVQDRSFDWQDVDLPDDPIRLHEWKRRRLQAAVVQALTRTRFLERHGRLLLFSDHGNRVGISMDNFWEERYHHILLATVGLPARNPDVAISLLDAEALLGLAPPMAVVEPVIEFTLSQPAEWPLLVKNAHLQWNGTIALDENLLTPIFGRLRSYRPWLGESPPKILPVFNGPESTP